MSRCCKDMRRIIKRLTGQDDNDNHHRKKGEEVIKKEDIKEQEPNDKKTRLTTSSMTSSIIDHIICAFSHFFPCFKVPNAPGMVEGYDLPGGGL